jgi:hypothetical protein
MGDVLPLADGRLRLLGEDLFTGDDAGKGGDAALELGVGCLGGELDLEVKCDCFANGSDTGTGFEGFGGELGFGGEMGFGGETGFGGEMGFGASSCVSRFLSLGDGEETVISG